MVVEPDANVIDAWERVRRRVREQLERHRRRIVGDAVKIRVRLGQLGKAEEGLEAAVCAELDVQLGFALAGNGQIESLENLRCERGAGDGAHGIRGVVGEVKFVRVGEGAELEESVISEDVGGGDGGVMNGGDVDEVVD